MGKLVVVRHHESEWNKLGLWTGVTDVKLTDYGAQKAREMGQAIKDICIDAAYTSRQIRSVQTLVNMMPSCTVADIPIKAVTALNERDYGDYTGKNKWEIEKEVGKEEFTRIRRGWDHPIPNGETLQMVYNRAVPFFLNTILLDLMTGKNILIVAHGNSIRSIMKYIENIPTDKISTVNMEFGEILIYDLDKEGHMLHKEVRQVKSEVHA